MSHGLKVIDTEKGVLPQDRVPQCRLWSQCVLNQRDGVDTPLQAPVCALLNESSSETQPAQHNPACF